MKHPAADNVTAFGLQQRQALQDSAWTGQWFKRAYIDKERGWIGDAKDQISTGAQSWAVLAGALGRGGATSANATALLSAIQQRLRDGAPFGAKQAFCATFSI